MVAENTKTPGAPGADCSIAMFPNGDGCRRCCFQQAPAVRGFKKERKLSAVGDENVYVLGERLPVVARHVGALDQSEGVIARIHGPRPGSEMKLDTMDGDSLVDHQASVGEDTAGFVRVALGEQIVVSGQV